MSDVLFRRTIGPEGDVPHVVLLHGLLGQGRNLGTAAVGLAARGYRVTTLDLPDHGQSPWSERLDYPSLAATVAAELGGPVHLLGHSLGGKVAMQVALRHRELVTSLVVVDIAPVAYASGWSEHSHHLRALQAMDLASITTRADADALLARDVHDARVRGFLLQNLERVGDGWRWRANLAVLARDLDAVAGFPVEGITTPYDGPVLAVAGGASSYVTEEGRDRMAELFPQSRLVRLKGVGHWVHAEAPELFLETVAAFLDRVTS